MTADVEKWKNSVDRAFDDIRELRQEVAAKDAKIERLRAEREVIGAEAVKYAGKSGRLEAKVDRLAEALQWYVDNDDTNDGQEGNEFWLAGRDRARALLREQEARNG